MNIAGFFGFSTDELQNINPTAAKWCCAIFILMVDIMGCCLPYFNANGEEAGKHIQFGNAFGIGAMLALGTVHLMQEAVEGFAEHPLVFDFHGVEIEMNAAWFGILITFVALIALEHGIPKSKHGHVIAIAQETSGSVVSVDDAEVMSKIEGGCHCAEKNGQLVHEASCELSHTRPSKSPLSCSVIIMIITLVIHSLLEGMVVGTASQASSAWIISIVLAGHKWIEGMIIGTELYRYGGLKANLPSVIAFCFGTPIGILLGIAVSADNESIETYAQMVAGCSILYVAMAELLSVTFEDGRFAKRKILLTCLGAFAVTYLTCWEVRSESTVVL